MLFGPDRRLWVGLGDGGSGGDPENRAQNPDTLLGKMLRLDVRVASPRPEIVALGLRNPWRYSFDRRTGVLWIGDVGQNSIEEIDRLERPGTDLVNFGWDVYEGASSFESKDLGPGRLVQPVAEYGRDGGCSVTGGYVYRGTGHPSDLRSLPVRRLLQRQHLVDARAAAGRSASSRSSVPGLSSFGEGLQRRALRRLARGHDLPLRALSVLGVGLPSDTLVRRCPTEVGHRERQPARRRTCGLCPSAA